MAVRHADASGGCIIENQHEEKRMSGTWVNKRGSGATSEEQLDKMEEDWTIGVWSSEYISVFGLMCCPGTSSEWWDTKSAGVRTCAGVSGRVDDDVRISALDALYEKDGRRSRYIGEVLEWYQGEDARDLQRTELVEKWTCLNVLEKKIFKSDPKMLTEEKSWRTWKSNQNIVMDEELDQNIVMDEELVQNVAMGQKFVKNFVMDAEIDPKVEMICPYRKLVDGTFCDPVIENCWKTLLREHQLQQCWLEFAREHQHVKVLVRWCNGTGDSTLQPVTICMNIQEDIHCGENLRGRNSWTFRWNIQRCDRNRANRCGRQGLPLIHLENYFGKYAQEVWKRNWCISVPPEASERYVVEYPRRPQIVFHLSFCRPEY